MDYRKLLVGVLLASLFAVGISSASFVGSASLYAPAVLLENNTGSLTMITVNVHTGTGSVKVIGPSAVNSSTSSSATTAAEYAASYLGKNFSGYNFTYMINTSGNVSGPSAGAAMTVLAISALSGQHLRSGFTITGTISSDGSIGEVGGVYDKTFAASRGGLQFILVPSAAADISEQQLYQLIQDSAGIPLIQVSNISGAEQYVEQGKAPVEQQIIYNPYINYNVSILTSAPFRCENCNASDFVPLVAFTQNLTGNSITSLGSDSAFATIASEMRSILDQSRQISSIGYYYVGADLAFLDYIDSYYFNNHNINAQAALVEMEKTQAFCGSLVAPQITSQNYEIVLGGQLRQGWGEQTIATDITSYNVTGLDTDEILNYIYSAGEANAWCEAASEMYSTATAIGGQPVAFSNSLAEVAQNRIHTASGYGASMYLVEAEKAYNQSDYAVAIIDADYVDALNSALGGSTNVSAIGGAANALARNSTYGLWSTQFANEAEFYLQESRISKNSTRNLTYADQAYSSAMLASLLSEDTSIIYSSEYNLSVQNGTQQSAQMLQLSRQISQLYGEVGALRTELSTLEFIIVILLALCAFLLGWIAMHDKKKNNVPSRREGRRKTTKR